MPQRERLYVIHRFRGQPHRDNVVIWRFHSRHMSEPVREELVIRKQNAELTRCWHRLNAPSGLSVICPTAVVKDEPRYRLSDLGGLVAHVVGKSTPRLRSRHYAFVPSCQCCLVFAGLLGREIPRNHGRTSENVGVSLTCRRLPGPAGTRATRTRPASSRLADGMCKDPLVPDTSLADYAEALLRRDFAVTAARLTAIQVDQIRPGHESIVRAVRECVQAGDYARALMYFGNDSDAGFLFLMDAMPKMTQAQRRQCLEDGWTHGFFGEHAVMGASRVPPRLLPRRAVTLFEMVPELRETVPLGLPERVPVYRGITARDRRRAKAHARQMSWTISRDLGAWFAHRRGERSHMFLAEAIVRRDRILAYFDARNEAEAVLDPETLEDLRVSILNDDDFQRAVALQSERTAATRQRLEALKAKREGKADV